MAKGTMIHKVFKSSGNSGRPPSKKHLGTTPKSKAVSATPGVSKNRTPSDRTWGG